LRSFAFTTPGRRSGRGSGPRASRSTTSTCSSSATPSSRRRKPRRASETGPMADFRELRLTSPHMRGREVELAQHRLHNNRYGEFYKPSHTDGVYGPETAAATKHAKYALGFPGSQITLRYDIELDLRLTGERPPAAMY